MLVAKRRGRTWLPSRPRHRAFPTTATSVTPTAVGPSRLQRAYIEDPRTGKVTGYALGDTVGDSRIERIQVDRVVLRHRHEIVQLLLGVQLTPMSSHAPEADTPPQRRADATSLSPSSGRSSAIKSGPGDGQIIGNGQAWLDRLGIPQGALSRAIESALPAQDSSDLHRKPVGPGERSKNGR